MYRVPSFYNCKLCGGSGDIVNKNNDEKITCPKCNGEGKYTNSGSIKERVTSGVVDYISIEITKEEGTNGYDTDVTYHINHEFGKEIEKHEYQLHAREIEVKINDNLLAGYTS